MYTLGDSINISQYHDYLSNSIWGNDADIIVFVAKKLILNLSQRSPSNFPANEMVVIALSLLFEIDRRSTLTMICDYVGLRCCITGDTTALNRILSCITHSDSGTVIHMDCSHYWL